MKNSLKTIVFAGLFAIPFIPFLVSGSLFFPFITTKAIVFRIIVEVVFGAWVLLALTDPEYRVRKGWLLYLLFIFLGIVGLADWIGAAPVKSFWSNFERMEGYALMLHLAAFWAVISSVFKEADWKKWWNISLVAAFIMALYCFLQVVGVKQISQGGVRVDGTFGNAIYLAVYMLFHFFIAALYLVREWKNKNMRLWYGALMILSAVVIYFTATRGTILGLLGGLVIFALLNIRNKDQAWVRKTSIGLLAALVVIIGGFFALKNTDFVKNSPVLSRFSTLSVSELQTQGRYYIWPMALEGIKEKPLLGWGQENFGYVFQEHYDPEMYNLEPWFDRAHNVFLDWAIAGGILALLAYLAFYVLALRAIWRKAPPAGGFSYIEKTVFTALLAAYAFHNIFVFDHLFSYILFFAVLAYLHTRSAGELLWKGTLSTQDMKTFAIPAVLLVCGISFYFLSYKPLSANLALIDALRATQSSQFEQAMKSFEKAYSKSPLGQQEEVEQMAVSSNTILSSNAPIEKRNEYYAFAKAAAIEQAENLPNEVRMQLISGLFLSSSGADDEGLKYLERAKTLSPTKQDIYFDLSSAYFNKNQPQKAIEALETAYNLAPGYMRARTMYLVGTIYIGDSTRERALKAMYSERDFVFDDSILGAYFSVKRYADVIAMLQARKKLDPANAATYDSYISQVRNQK